MISLDHFPRPIIMGVSVLLMGKVKLNCCEEQVLFKKKIVGNFPDDKENGSVISCANYSQLYHFTHKL